MSPQCAKSDEEKGRKYNWRKAEARVSMAMTESTCCCLQGCECNRGVNTQEKGKKHIENDESKVMYI